MKKKPYDKSVYRSFSMVLQVGINMLVPISMMTALGVFLDKELGTSYWMIILFFVGAIAGGQNSYRMIKKFIAPSKEERQRENVIGQKETGSSNASDRYHQENK